MPRGLDGIRDGVGVRIGKAESLAKQYGGRLQTVPKRDSASDFTVRNGLGPAESMLESLSFSESEATDVNRVLHFKVQRRQIPKVSCAYPRTSPVFRCLPTYSALCIKLSAASPRKRNSHWSRKPPLINPVTCLVNNTDSTLVLLRTSQL